MSLRAMTWALEDAPVEDPTALLVLWALAERAHSDGTAAWPTRGEMAHRARCSVRSVQRKTNELEESGIIRRGDQRLVAHIPARSRPVVWDLDLSLLRDSTPTRISERDARLARHPGGRKAASEMTPGDERDDTQGHAEMTLLAHRTAPLLPTEGEPRAEPTTSDPSLRSGSGQTADDEERTDLDLGLRPPATPSEARAPGDAFEVFWSVYPRRSDKIDTRKAWKTSGAEKIAEQVIAGAERYRDDPNRELEFTKGPASWLRKGCWDDDPLPARRGPVSRAEAQNVYLDGIFDGAMERARAADTAEEQHRRSADALWAGAGRPAVGRAW